MSSWFYVEDTNKKVCTYRSRKQLLAGHSVSYRRHYIQSVETTCRASYHCKECDYIKDEKRRITLLLILGFYLFFFSFRSWKTRLKHWKLKKWSIGITWMLEVGKVSLYQKLEKKQKQYWVLSNNVELHVRVIVIG